MTMTQRTDQRTQGRRRVVTWRLTACAALVAIPAIQCLIAPAGAAAAASARPGASPAGQAAAARGGTLRSWGNNAYGQLGNGAPSGSVSSPVKVKLPAGVRITSVRAGCNHVVALTTTGKVLAWGSNQYGQLGNGGTADSSIPVRVRLPAGTRAKAVRAGCGHSLALTTTGKVLAWGNNQYGQLGNGSVTTVSNSPVRVKLPAAVKVKAISAGGGQNLALTTTGRVLAWGSNLYGELGTGSTAQSSNIPVRVKLPTGTNVTALAAGGALSLVLTSTGRVLDWGDNSDGELGDGTLVNHNTPVRVKLPARTRVRGLFAGCGHALALTTAGKVLAWGNGKYGQLGDGTNTISSVPVRVKIPAGTTVTGIGAGCIHSLALTSKGRVLAWGDNGNDELGNGSIITGSNTPVRVALPASLAAITLGPGPSAQFSLAIVRARP